MEAFSDKDSLEEYQRKMAHNRRIKNQAIAIMQRAKNANIPKKFMRINQTTFESLLDSAFHDNISSVSNYVYKNPLSLLKKEFVLIDGGSDVERKTAGFAILFRLISCDRRGFHKNGTELAHQLQSIGSSDYGMGRNDITDMLRSTDALFLSEVAKADFRKNFETGGFFDEVLSYRDDHVKTTIVSFQKQFPFNQAFENEDNIMKETNQFGQYMCSFTQTDKSKVKDKRFFRIRVKTNG